MSAQPAQALVASDQSSEFTMEKVSVQIGDGCAVSDEIGYFTGFPDALTDDSAFTRLFTLNLNAAGLWFHQDWSGDRAVSVCLRQATQHAPRAVCALSDEGTVRIANSAGIQLETIPGAGISRHGNRGLGPLRRIREIAGSLYACGMGNQLYKRIPSGWQALDQTMTAGSAASQNHAIDQIRSSGGQLSEAALLNLTASIGIPGGLDDIGGTSAADIYACGVGGALWHWNGSDWTRVPIRSDEHLHCLHVVSKDLVLVAGHNGTLLRGNAASGFQSLLGAEVSDNFWSLRMFGDACYLGTTKGLLRLQGSQLAQVDLPQRRRRPVIQALDSSANALWVAADRYVARLFAGHWQVYEHPDNV